MSKVHTGRRCLVYKYPVVKQPLGLFMIGGTGFEELELVLYDFSQRLIVLRDAQLQRAPGGFNRIRKLSGFGISCGERIEDLG